MKVDLSCPIELWEYSLPTEEKSVCSFTFFNLGDRAISSIQITVTFFDARDDVVSRRVERPMALDVGGREPFDIVLPAEDARIDAIDLSIDKVWFEDGDEWRRAQEARLVDYTPNELPPNRKLEQLRYIAGSDAIGYPSEQYAVWICVCGRVNAAEERKCRRCGREKAVVFERFSPEAVADAIDRRERVLEQKARQAREEASRQEFIRQEKSRRKRRARRTRTAVICVALVLGVTSYLFVVLGMPELRYQTAMSALASGDAAVARAGFSELTDYRDARDMVKECDLRIASQYLYENDQAKLESAIQILNRLADYPGASEMMQEATYQKAVVLLTDKAYGEAAAALSQVAGYRDADTLLKQAEYQQAAMAMEAGEYETAAELFAALGGYLDAAVQAKECVYRPALALMAAEQYDEAADMLAGIAGYSDADEQRLQCIYLSALRAMNAGEHDRASELFTQLGSYEDAGEQMKRSIYLAANTARDTGQYETAQKMYESIKDFEDAAEQAKACTYLPAVTLMAEGKYEEAAALFLTIGGYKDADSLYSQCLYNPAEQALEAGDYESAIALFGQIKGYGDATKKAQQAGYALAEQLESEGDYEAAAEAFRSLENYLDAEDRMNAAQYAYAEEAFDAGEYETASERFALIGKYRDAQARVKECAYELALALTDDDDLQGTYDMLMTIEEYEPAVTKAAEIIYTLAERQYMGKRFDSAAKSFALAGKYEDAQERYCDAIYQQATALMRNGKYEEAGSLYDSIADYTDAAEKRDECYDLWLYEIANTIWMMHESELYPMTLALYRQIEDINALPKKYEQLKTIYYDSNLKIARQLISEGKTLDAYPYLLECKGYRNADTLLDKNLYRLLGTWKSEEGDTYAFYLDGTCSIKGQTYHYNMLNAYGILTGNDAGNLERTHSFSSGSENGLTLTEDATGTRIRLTRTKPAEQGPGAEAAEEGAQEEAGDGVTSGEQAAEEGEAATGGQAAVDEEGATDGEPEEDNAG